MICKHCGKRCSAGKTYCTNCGKPLVDGASSVQITYIYKRIKWYWYILAFVVGFVIYCMIWKATGNAAEPADQTPISSLNVGDTYVFGSYEQDGNKRNGAEPIEWVVLKKDGAQALLISRYILDAMAYESSGSDIAWSESSIRKWLNGDFYEKAFSGTEKNNIILTQHDNPNSFDFYDTDYTLVHFGEDTAGKGNGADGGEETSDKVFLLAWNEALEYFGEDADRKALATAYAKEDGVYHVAKENYEKDGWDETMIGNGIWWLRSPGGSSASAMSIYYDGRIHNNPVDASYEGVRPVIWVTDNSGQ